jgi:hypothetical protein
VWVLAGLPVVVGWSVAGPPAAAAGPGYAWPVPAPHPVARGFDPPESDWGAGHRGVDLGASGGAVVRSAAAGSVVFAGLVAGRGVVVVGHARGLRTTYEPVLAAVRVGAHVDMGDPLGRLTLAGGHCLPRVCLHWGAIRGGTYLDPLSLLGRSPAQVRLLPVWGRSPSAAGAPGPPWAWVGSALGEDRASGGIASVAATPAVASAPDRAAGSSSSRHGRAVGVGAATVMGGAVAAAAATLRRRSARPP